MQQIELKRFHGIYTKDIYRNTSSSGLIGCVPVSSIDQFEKRLLSLINGVFVEFYTLSVSGECKGCVYAYEYKSDDLHMKVALESITMTMPERLEAMGLFLQLLFRRYPLKKVFLETVDDKEFEEQIERMGFKHEITLSAVRYVNSAYRDLNIFSCYREDFSNEGLSTL